MFSFQGTVRCEELLRQEPRVGTWRQKLKRRRWRDVDDRLLSFLSHLAQLHLPRDGAAKGGLEPPISFSYQENVSQANLMGAIPQRRGPLPRNVKVTTEICYCNPLCAFAPGSLTLLEQPSLVELVTPALSFPYICSHSQHFRAGEQMERLSRFLKVRCCRAVVAFWVEFKLKPPQIQSSRASHSFLASGNLSLFMPLPLEYWD